MAEKESSLSSLDHFETSYLYTKKSSIIMLIGLKIHTTPVEAVWPQAIFELCCLNHIEEATILSTCNKIEIYVITLSRK